MEFRPKFVALFVGKLQLPTPSTFITHDATAQTPT